MLLHVAHVHWVHAENLLLLICLWIEHRLWESRGSATEIVSKLPAHLAIEQIDVWSG